jgi:hypothetical protein
MLDLALFYLDEPWYLDRIRLMVFTGSEIWIEIFYAYSIEPRT